MAPEQVKGGELSPACDIYSLGVILYQLLTGRLPFEGPMAVVLGLIAVTEPSPPSEHRAGLNNWLEAICLKAMAKNAEDRFASMAQMAEALTEYLRRAGKTIIPVPTGTPAVITPRLNAALKATSAKPNPPTPAPARPAPAPRPASEKVLRRTPSERTHSGLGITSFIFGLLTFVWEGLLFVLIGIVGANSRGGLTNGAATVFGLAFLAGALFPIFGVSMGLAGLFQSDRKRVFAILGFCLNGLIILGVGALICMGMTVGTK
jgi:hypothetical protein